jgi:hypothetical protein
MDYGRAGITGGRGLQLLLNRAIASAGCLRLINAADRRLHVGKHGLCCMGAERMSLYPAR